MIQWIELQVKALSIEPPLPDISECPIVTFRSRPAIPGRSQVPLAQFPSYEGTPLAEWTLKENPTHDPFSGSFRTTLTNDDWRALTPHPNDTKVDDVVPTYEFTAGGPVMRDHLWFFVVVRVERIRELALVPPLFFRQRS